MQWSRETEHRTFVVLLMMALLGFGCSGSVIRGEELRFRVLDDFEEKLALEWEPLRHDPTNVSPTRNPGKLTITTQAGTISADESRSGVPPAQNLYLIPNPVEDGGDFVVTACIESFKPTLKWQQAGLLIYDDNYLKCDMHDLLPFLFRRRF